MNKKNIKSAEDSVKTVGNIAIAGVALAMCSLITVGISTAINAGVGMVAEKVLFRNLKS